MLESLSDIATSSSWTNDMMLLLIYLMLKNNNEIETDEEGYKSFEVPTSSHSDKNRFKATQIYRSWMWWSLWVCWLWTRC